MRLCGLITPHPKAVRERFDALYRQEGPQAATAWFYQMCRDCDYIKVDHIAKNLLFEQDTHAGRLEITINLSKPEKDPRDIAKALTAKQVSYPPCMLCVENPGYAGRPGFPARQNHRVVPIDLAGAPFYLQYSPYLYYGEHCIVFNRVHRPMAIDHDAFCRLFAFVEKFPHYFLGSNADLPIVGGSILSHDHFQGGNHAFPMDRAGVRVELRAPDPRVQAYVADWPMTCVRLTCPEKEPLIQAADAMLAAWRGYSDPELGILAHTDVPHNTITPIVRRQGAQWGHEPGTAQQPHRQGASPGHLPSPQRPASHQEGEHRPHRGDGPVHPAWAAAQGNGPVPGLPHRTAAYRGCPRPGGSGI